LDSPRGAPEASIGDLFTRLTEDGKAFARAEVGLYRAIARRRISKAAGGAIALVVAFLLLNAALITLVISIAAAIAIKLGPIAGGAITFVAIGIIAFILVKWGTAKLSALSGDEDEKAALAAGERLA
jgi:hypothetical protein